MSDLTIQWHKSIQEIKESEWQKLIAPYGNPFFEWSWLDALERSQSVHPKTGWQPLHLSLWRNKELIAIAPLYLKGHSYGEFIFDSPFQQLSFDLGLNYYPKLIGMSPLSPVEGYRFFVAIKEDELEISTIIFNEIDIFAKKNNILSCNFLYADSDWAKIAEAANCAKWLNKHSLWLGDNQENFSEYLSGFNSNQRRNIKRERKSIKDSKIIISALTGDHITQNIMERMYFFYELHCSKWGPWGSKYLSKSFFEELVFTTNKEKLVLFNARHIDSEESLAMSLCVFNNKKLWGRYWGSKEEIDCLHFELCYYSPIEWSLSHGIKSFDPGAGGNHKLRRGFKARQNISLHRWYNNKMDYLIRLWLPKSNQSILKEIESINNQVPFKSQLPSI